MARSLPPDPEGMNDARAAAAELALLAFSDATGCDQEDALADLLCNLRHWADRNQVESFVDALQRSSLHYSAETAEEP